MINTISRDVNVDLTEEATREPLRLDVFLM